MCLQRWYRAVIKPKKMAEARSSDAAHQCDKAKNPEMIDSKALYRPVGKAILCLRVTCHDKSIFILITKLLEKVKTISMFL